MGDKIKVLITDDNIEFSNLLNEYISKYKDMCVVGMAKDGIEAIEKIKTLEPDIVILDIVMPNLDGLGVLEKFHDVKKGKKPLFIVLSAISQDLFIRKAISLGAEYYIVKPFDASVLVERIRQIAAEKDTESFLYQNSIVYNSLTQGNKYNLKENSTIEEAVTDIMHSLGISPHMAGHKYLREAIIYIVENPDALNSVTKTLYPYIAKKFSSTSQKVERAMRNAINKAWAKTNPQIIKSLFGSTIDAKKGKPTNSEFIALIADNIRVKFK